MRLLRATKDKVASRAAQEKYAVAIKDAQDKLWKYANELITAKVGDKFLQEIIADANHHNLNKAFSVTFFTRHEKERWGKECKTVKIPEEVFIPFLTNIEITELEMSTLTNYIKREWDCKDLRNSLQTRLKRTMDNLRTYNRIVELLPELKPHLDEEIKKIGDEVPTAKKSSKESMDRAVIQTLRKELKR
nr:MAG TPA: Nucleotide modification associated domain 5 [Caudoviricetes sp.]